MKTKTLSIFGALFFISSLTSASPVLILSCTGGEGANAYSLQISKGSKPNAEDFLSASIFAISQSDASASTPIAQYDFVREIKPGIYQSMDYRFSAINGSLSAMNAILPDGRTLNLYMRCQAVSRPHGPYGCNNGHRCG